MNILGIVANGSVCNDVKGFGSDVVGFEFFCKVFKGVKGLELFLRDGLNVSIFTPFHQVFSSFFSNKEWLGIKDTSSVFCYSCVMSFFVDEENCREFVFKFIGLNFFCSDFNDFTV